MILLDPAAVLGTRPFALFAPQFCRWREGAKSGGHCTGKDQLIFPTFDIYPIIRSPVWSRSFSSTTLSILSIEI